LCDLISRFCIVTKYEPVDFKISCVGIVKSRTITAALGCIKQTGISILQFLDFYRMTGKVYPKKLFNGLPQSYSLTSGNITTAFRAHFQCNCNISTVCDTEWPADDHAWLKHVTLLIRLINININKVVLTVNKCFYVVKYVSIRRSIDHHHKYPPKKRHTESKHMSKAAFLRMAYLTNISLVDIPICHVVGTVHLHKY
jgi:hypothetical protein